ncbi:transposable element Tcb2 transposase [Trichonephila clavipes]|nr:transposable element Tcb2 transposase [Trichonephila clavipes]
MARRNHLGDFTRGIMIEKREEGRTVTSVAAEFGINKRVSFRALGKRSKPQVQLLESTKSDSQHVLIWREIGTLSYTSNIKERHHYGDPGVLVWGGIMLNGRTELHIFDRGSVIGYRYCEEVLLPHVRLFRGAIGLAFIFMDDNARPHRTLAVEELQEREDITRMN